MPADAANFVINTFFGEVFPDAEAVSVTRARLMLTLIALSGLTVNVVKPAGAKPTDRLPVDVVCDLPVDYLGAILLTNR